MYMQMIARPTPSRGRGGSGRGRLIGMIDRLNDKTTGIDETIAESERLLSQLESEIGITPATPKAVDCPTRAAAADALAAVGSGRGYRICNVAGLDWGQS